MDKIINLKLISTSKTMLHILRILFVVLTIIALIPWIAPTSTLGNVLMSMFDIQLFNGAKLHHLSDNGLSNGAFYNFNLLSRYLGFMGSIISMLPLFIGTVIMMHLSKNYASGKIFTISNAKSYSVLGIIYLSSAILLNPLSQLFFSLAVSINNPVGQRFIAFSFNVSNLTAIFFAMVLIMIGQVMKLGQKIHEVQELTI